MSAESEPIELQAPAPGMLNLDHLAHFVPDRDACLAALLRLGFAPAPFSLQYHRTHADAALVAAGSGNHCVMLRTGYLEFLVPIADTSVAAQLRSAIARYVGAHSIVFGTNDADDDYRRLQREGFEPLPPIALQRPIATPAGEDTARFTVVRVPPAAMAEGRIQFCRHHTEALVWQRRWLQHPNGAVGLRGALVCVQDLEEAAARYRRFTAIEPQAAPGMRRFETGRGWIELYDRTTIEAALPVSVPAVPWIAGCALQSSDLALTRRVLAANGVSPTELGAGRIAVAGPPAIGGAFIFVE
jgi:hypothetical protein